MVAPSFDTLVLYVVIVPKRKGGILMETGGGERRERKGVVKGGTPG
jgi:hypothetical protein